MTGPDHPAPQPGDSLRVVAAHRASYGNPISLRAGDRVIAAPTLSTEEVRERFQNVEVRKPYLRFVDAP